MGKLALDAKPAPAVLPVGHTHPLPSYLGGSGLHGERDVLLQDVQPLVRLGLERVGKHAAVRRSRETRRRESAGAQAGSRQG